MLKTLVAVLAGLGASLALAQDAAVGNETPAADQAAEKPVAQPAKTAAADAGKEGKEFKPPPGFYSKKRGAITLYCKRDRETGTRFSTEKCFDEDQIHEYLLALEVQKRDVDRIRATCTTASVCAPQ
jgi:hypothetical protein